MGKRKTDGKGKPKAKKAKPDYTEQECDPTRPMKEHSPGDLKFLCLNLNGIRAATKKDLKGFLEEEKADFVCFSELKCMEEENPLKEEFEELKYNVYWADCTAKKGYAGSAILSLKEPISVSKGIGASDNEGRAITLEFEKFFLVNTYVPNSGEGLKFESRRKAWDTKMKAHLEALSKKKSVIWTGDLNVAIQDFDVYDGETNKRRCKSPGFTPYERKNFGEMCSDIPLVDVYRDYYPTKKNTFTFFSYRGNMRPTNRGWRLDYFCVSKELMPSINSIEIRKEAKLSDHLPLVLSMKDLNGTEN